MFIYCTLTDNICCLDYNDDNDVYWLLQQYKYKCTNIIMKQYNIFVLLSYII